MKSKEKDVSENTLYHDTWTLLRKYGRYKYLFMR